jgi:methyl-accepting chemotaxis protein
MDKVTQQVAANAEESASASEELSAQAETMRAMVQDLVALVGGVRLSAKALPGQDDQSKGMRLLPRPKREADQTAEKLIPLEEDDKDFTEF